MKKDSRDQCMANAGGHRAPKDLSAPRRANDVPIPVSFYNGTIEGQRIAYKNNNFISFI